MLLIKHKCQKYLLLAVCLCLYSQTLDLGRNTEQENAANQKKNYAENEEG